MAGFKFLSNYSSLFSNISYGCLNIIALLLALNMGRNMSKHLDIDEDFGGVLGLVAYVCMSPTVFNVIVGKTPGTATGLSMDVTGSTSIFYAMIVAVVTIYVYNFFSKFEKIKIKLPDSVPPNVGVAFSSLTPTIITIFLLVVVRFAYFSLTGKELSVLIYTALQVPVNAVIQTPFGFIGASVLASLLWAFGIHGSSMVGALMKPMLIGALTKNIELVNSGKVPTEIVTRPFNFMFGAIGGFGCTLALVVAILIFSKREDDRAIGKLGLPSVTFQINEPVIFGLPIVMNVMYIIPFMIAPAVSSIIGYIATSQGLMNITYIDVPWCMPPFINAFLATGGDIRAVIVQLVAFAVCVAIYAPFVIIRNKEIINQRSNNEYEISR
jgi:cellobiose PTS system EIIC component